MSHCDTSADLGESEPPHIKNWFSSYEYESFVLETNDNFGFSEHPGSQGLENESSNGNILKSTENPIELVTNGKDEGLLIKCNRSEEENKSQKQVLDTQDSPLLSSEPPGIENWFSSYAYESPEVDAVDDLIGSNLKESTVDCNEKMKGYEKDENLRVTPDALACNHSSTKDDKNSTELLYDNGSRKLEEPGNSFVSFSTKDNKNSTDLPNNDANVNSIENGNRKLEEPGNCSVNCSKKDDKISTDLPNNDANVNSFENGSRKLEEPGNGFVSIKSKKENYESSKRVKGVDRKRCVDSPTNKMQKSDERVTLGDVTNILDEHTSVPGKWKCPRKRKPDVGPPLKQLRLGQWFHRV